VLVNDFSKRCTVALLRNRKGACPVKTYLAFDEMANSRLGHDGDGDRVHDLLDHLGVAHAGYATLGSNVGGDALEGHDG
jgi:hypothetical protein